jgi:hypothetical protein
MICLIGLPSQAVTSAPGAGPPASDANTYSPWPRHTATKPGQRSGGSILASRFGEAPAWPSPSLTLKRRIAAL